VLKTSYLVEDSRELTDEELEQVIGGASREAFLHWAAEQYNVHRKNENDKQLNEKPTRTGDDRVCYYSCRDSHRMYCDCSAVRGRD